MDPMIAIINADLVRSSALDDDQRAMIHDWLSSLPSVLAAQFEGDSEYMVDAFRGDSWQLLLPEPNRGLRVALYQQAWLRASFPELRLQARQGIGIGRQQMSETFELARADGPAFRRAGQALEASYQGVFLQLSGPEDFGGYPQASLNTMFTLINELSAHWTGKQAQAVLGALFGKTQEQIGAGWPDGPISQQAVGQHLRRAGWASIEQSLDFFEGWLPSLLSDTNQ